MKSNKCESNLFNRNAGLIKVKVKVKLYLCSTKHRAMKTYWGSGGIAPRILKRRTDIFITFMYHKLTIVLNLF